MTRKSGGCFSGCGNFLFWFFVLALLTYGWIGSTWPLRALEILLALVVVGAFRGVRGRRGGRKA